MDELHKKLEYELTIVDSWNTNTRRLDRKLDNASLDKFKMMPLYKKTFLGAVVALRKSAEKYLNQPIHLFGRSEVMKK